MPQHKFERKQFIVDRKIQFRVARFVMLFTVAIAFITSSIVFFTTLFILEEKLAAVYPQVRLLPIVRSAYIVFFANLAIFLPFIFIASIRFSHRIVGPLPRIYRYLKELGKGSDPGRLHIRPTDMLKELAQAINELADLLKSRGIVAPSPTQDPQPRNKPMR